MRVTRQICFASILLLFLVGCGYSGTGSTSTYSATSATASPPTDMVSIQVDHPTYHTRDEITLVISNRRTHPLFFTALQTNCTAVLLQRQAQTTWEPLSNCQEKRPMNITALQAGHQLTVKLSSPAQGWSTGPYRAQFRYSTTASTGFDATNTVSSPPFQVS